MIPPAIHDATRDDPPYDTNGSGMPFVGIRQSTTLKLIAA
jgi:hypothetical protein